MRTNFVIQELRYNNVFSTYDEAYAFLVNFTYHLDGQIVVVKYYKSAEEDPTGNDPVGCLVAMGVKNFTECGPAGIENPDRYLNKYYPINTYPNGPCGEEFFELINGKGSGQGSEVDPIAELGDYETTITLNGVTFTVANFNGQDEETTDPLEWTNLSYNV